MLLYNNTGCQYDTVHSTLQKETAVCTTCAMHYCGGVQPSTYVCVRVYACVRVCMCDCMCACVSIGMYCGSALKTI